MDGAAIAGGGLAAAVPAPELMLGAEEYQQAVHEMVQEHAPRVFAVVRDILCEYDEPGAGPAVQLADSEIVAWGMQFDGYSEVVGTDGRTRMQLRSVSRALKLFGYGPGASARLVWATPDGRRP